MHSRKRLSIKSVTLTGIAASLLLGLAGVTFSPAPAHAVIYCSYVGYPAGCVARAGVVLRPRQMQCQPQYLLLVLSHQRVERRPRSRLRFAYQLHLRSSRLQALLRPIWSVHCP